jgi:hypothetical protein
VPGRKQRGSVPAAGKTMLDGKAYPTCQRHKGGRLESVHRRRLAEYAVLDAILARMDADELAAGAKT